MSSKTAAILAGAICLLAGAVLVATGSAGEMLAGETPIARILSLLPLLLAGFGLLILILAATGRASGANIAVAAFSLLFVGHALAYGDWLVDDAAISFTYARNFAEGHGLVLYPGAEPVEGYSNPLWVLLMAAGHALGVSFIPLVKTLGIGCALGAILIAWHLTRKYLGVSSGLAAIVPLLLALNSVYVMWSVSGLENPLLALLIMAAVWATAWEIERQRVPLVAPLVCALLATVRPESVLYGGAIGLVAVILTPRGGRLSHAGRWLVFFVAPFVLFLGWRYWYFGALVPNTYYAKSTADVVSSTIRHIFMGARYLVGAWTEQGAAIFAAVAVFGLSVRRHSRWLLLAALAAGIAFVLKAGWDWMGAGRFVAHLAPIWIVLVVAGFDVIRQRGLSGRYVALAIVVGTAFYGYSNWQIFEKEAAGRLCPFQRVADTGRWYAAVAKQLHLTDPSLATVDLGGTALYADMKIIDLAGLANAEIARAAYEGDYGPEFFSEFLGADKPTFIHIHSGWTKDSGIPSLPLIENEYYEMTPPPSIHPPRHHFIRRDAVTGRPLEDGVTRRMADGVELIGVRPSEDSNDLLLLWRANVPLGSDVSYAWEITDADGDVLARQDLLYGLVAMDQVEVGRVHREYVPMNGSPAEVEVHLQRRTAD